MFVTVKIKSLFLTHVLTSLLGKALQSTFFSHQQSEREADCKVNKDNAQYRVLICAVFFTLSVLRACLPGDGDLEDPV